MANKKKPDNRVPNPMNTDSVQFFNNFFETVPNHILGLHSIHAKETKSFKKVSNDEVHYCDDVMNMMLNKKNKIATNVTVENLQSAAIASEQFSKIATSLTELATLFSRNALQANGYRYQHSATFEDDVDSAIRSEVKGSLEIKERLESNRKKRNDAAAATRSAKEAKKMNISDAKKSA